MAITIGGTSPIDASTLEGNDALGQPISTATQAALDGKLDSAIQAAIDLNTAKVGITPTQASDIIANNAKISNVDHPLVETAVPVGAIFTDTVYDDTAIQAEVTANTAKVSNVSTNLSISRDATTVTVESSDGTNAVIPSASITEAGMMSAADKVALDAAGSGGGSIIGDLQPLYVNTVNGLYINAAGEHWLETGNVSTDLVTYPDAKRGATSGGVYASNSFGQATTSASGLTFDGTFFWESHTNINRLYKFNSAGVYQGSYMTVAVSNIVSVCMGVGSALHAMASNGQVYEYVAGNNTLIDQFDAGATVPAPQGITWDGTYFWVVSNSTDTVYRLNADGTDSGFSFSISSQSLTPSGIHWNGSYLIVTDSSNSIAYLYEPSGTYSGIFFDVSSEDATPMDITGDGTHLWVVGLATTTNYAYTDYSPFVGIATAETDTSTSLPIFVRIK